MTRSAPTALDWNRSVTALLVIGSTLWFGVLITNKPTKDYLSADPRTNKIRRTDVLLIERPRPMRTVRMDLRHFQRFVPRRGQCLPKFSRRLVGITRENVEAHHGAVPLRRPRSAPIPWAPISALNGHGCYSSEQTTAHCDYTERQGERWLALRQRSNSRRAWRASHSLHRLVGHSVMILPRC
jgi:hypothetical protein